MRGETEEFQARTKLAMEIPICKGATTGQSNDSEVFLLHATENALWKEVENEQIEMHSVIECN